jgi:Arc/MetJ-type ribon-helix-helix transcriptional regulator
MNFILDDPLDSSVSVFHGSFTTPSDSISVRQLQNSILSGEFRNAVEPVREALRLGKKDEAERLKKGLPSFTLSGEITDGDRKQALQQHRFLHSGWLQADFDRDGLGNRTPTDVRKILQEDEHVALAALSPSETGVKAFVRIPRCKTVEEHKRAFQAAAVHFSERYGLNLDLSTKDPTRLCFVTYDPDAFIRDDAVLLPLAPVVPIAPLKKKSERVGVPSTDDHLARSNRRRKWSVFQVSEMLACIPPCPPYDEWLEISSAVWNEFGEAEGTALLEAWSPEDYPEKYSEKFPVRLSEFGLGTVIKHARKAGWKFDRNQRQIGGFPLTHVDEIGEISEPMDFVEDLLTDGGASVIYGPSNIGKSFWILDLAVAVASGRCFGGQMTVDQGAVVYVALEGSSGVRNRIQALKKKGLLPKGAPLFLCFASISLFEQGDTESLVAAVKKAAAKSELPCRLVILDTLSRAMAGGDENNPKDMTHAVKSVDAVRAATGAHVSLVHHCGKEIARGARGHSSLRAAVDTEIEITRPEGSFATLVTVMKQRDLPARSPMAFHLESVELGIGRRGKAITSCIVCHEAEFIVVEKKVGRPSITTENAVLALLPQKSTTAWQRAAEDTLDIGRSAFYDVRRRLKDSGLAISDGKRGWEAKIQFPNQQTIEL